MLLHLFQLHVNLKDNLSIPNMKVQDLKYYSIQKFSTNPRPQGENSDTHANIPKSETQFHTFPMRHTHLYHRTQQFKF